MLEEHDFEREVLRIARYLWHEAEYGGSVNVEGKERDGVFQTEDCTHIIEATTSRKKEKAEQDLDKIAGLIRTEIAKNTGKGVRGWFVTLDEPTSDQRDVLRRRNVSQFRNQINVLSFSQFQSKIIDVRDYFSLREKHPFGSVRDPGTEDINPKSGYIDLDCLDIDTKKLNSIADLSEGLLRGTKYVLLGDYGSGKSMTVRETYLTLKMKYLSGDTSCFPIAINLREHFGQDDPAEVLERHGRKIGYPKPDHLVRAWKTGYGVLLLDGFDEISNYGINGSWKRLKDIRYKSLEPIRNIVNLNPKNTGVLIAGRLFYIEDMRELKNALGIGNTATTISLSEILRDPSKGVSKEVWDWRQPPELASDEAAIHRSFGRAGDTKRVCERCR